MATPYAWLLSQRLSLAEAMLETTSLPVEQMAARVGYRSAAVFREQFAARRGVAPRDYRKTLSRTSPQAAFARRLALVRSAKWLYGGGRTASSCARGLIPPPRVGERPGFS